MTSAEAKIVALNQEFGDESRGLEPDEWEARGAEEILTLAIKNYHPRLALSASFGAPEGMVLLDMMHRIDPAARVFVLDTGRLHPATHELIDRVRDRYGKAVEVVFPRASEVEYMVGEYGMNLFYGSVEMRKHCCRIRKVEPLRRYFADLDAYVSGLRRDQNLNRRDTPKMEVDVGNGGLLKFNPLADWTREQVMEYVAEHRVPTNSLHARGFPSVGCQPCTRAVRPGEDERAGRWWWEADESKECGLHVADDQEGGLGI
jgi:thioredoxin-dependent adenylylsulfate APS reductase